MIVAIITGITIGLENTTYTVTEEDPFIEVCAVIIEGSLRRTANVTLSTSDLTATSEYITIWK